jgi:hypothetical protein
VIGLGLSIFELSALALLAARSGEPPGSASVFAEGIWDDGGVWSDVDVWRDAP